MSRAFSVPHAGLLSYPNRSSGPAQKIGLRRASPICTPGVMPWGISSLAGVTGGRVERGSATAFFILPITKLDQLGGDLLRDGAQRLPGGCVSHGSNHEGNRTHEVVKACQGLGNVCRA